MDLHKSTPFRGNDGWAWFCYERIDWDPNWDDLVTLLEMIRSDLANPETKGELSWRLSDLINMISS